MSKRDSRESKENAVEQGLETPLTGRRLKKKKSPELEDINLQIERWTVAAAAKSLQSCPTLCDPIDVSPRGSPVPGILQARILEWVAISFSNAAK